MMIYNSKYCVISHAVTKVEKLSRSGSEVSQVRGHLKCIPGKYGAGVNDIIYSLERVSKRREF